MYTHTRNFAAGLILLIGLGCDESAQRQSTDLPRAHFEHGAQLAAIQEFDSALSLLRLAFEAGYPSPMQVITKPGYAGLIQHPEYRPRVRSLLQEFARESSAQMSGLAEPGRPIEVIAVVGDAATGKTLLNVEVELAQADSTGQYFQESGLWNPRIFAYLRTDSSGFKVRSIYPGSYRDDAGQPVPPHIHFTLRKEGYHTYASEFTFEDDRIFQMLGSNEVPVARVWNDSGRVYYRVQLGMQKER